MSTLPDRRITATRWTGLLLVSSVQPRRQPRAKGNVGFDMAE